MLGLTIATALAAQPIPCDREGPQQAMNVCARQDFERADTALNAAYRTAIEEARRFDAEPNREFDQRATHESVLRDAQRAWVTFRDAWCTYEGYREARGGTMEPLVYNSCRETLTQERTRQLQAESVNR